MIGRKKERISRQREKERRENEIQFYKDHVIGRYFLIEHHSAAHSFIGPIPEDICYGNSKQVPGIDVYTNTSKSGVRLDIEPRHINPLWLGNPYSCGSGNTMTKCKEISKEEFDSMKNIVSNAILSIPTKIE